MNKPKTALVIEGGGMRSSYVAGALMALHDQEIRDFDLVVATSAGACCAANFLVGQPEFNQYVLEEKLSSRRFVNFFNIPTTRNIMDIDYLIDECFDTLKPLSEKLRGHPTKFLITATNCNTGETLYLDAARENLWEALRTTCAMPYLYRRKLFRGKHRVMDGGITTSIPIHRAITEGCREIIVICSKPQGYRKRANQFGWLTHLFYPRYPQMARALCRRHEHYNRELDCVEHPPEGVRVVAVRPQGDLPVSRVTTDRTRVRAGIRQGFHDGNRVVEEFLFGNGEGPNSGV